MDNNTRKTIECIMACLVAIVFLIGAAWIMSPQEFTFKIEMDNNTKDAVESVDYDKLTSQIPKCEKLDNYTAVCPEGYVEFYWSDEFGIWSSNPDFNSEYWFNNGSGIYGEVLKTDGGRT